METPSLQDPLFATYVIAAADDPQAVGMSLLTVYRMMSENAGFRSPGPAPDAAEPVADQAARAQRRVERIRRIR